MKNVQQGTDFTVRVKFPDPNNPGQYVLLADWQDVILALFTDKGEYILKGSMVARDGFITLTKDSTTILSFPVDKTDSINFSIGELICYVYPIFVGTQFSDGDIDSGQTFKPGIYITSNPMKGYL